MGLNFKKNIAGIIGVFIVISLLVGQFIYDKNKERKLIKFEETNGKIIKIKEYGVHSPAGFYYTYSAHGKNYEGYTSGKISKEKLKKEIKIKYSIEDNSISEVLNLETIIIN